MKTDEKSTLQTDKEELKKIISEVKAIVSSIIDLPAEKIASLGTAAVWNGAVSAMRQDEDTRLR